MSNANKEITRFENVVVQMIHKPKTSSNKKNLKKEIIERITSL